MNQSRQIPIKRWVTSLALIAGLLTASFAASVPEFVTEGIYAPNKAVVHSVINSDSAAVVLLDGGLEQGLRCGMICRIERGSQAIAEIILIASETDKAAGLILSLNQASTIQSGDIARIQTIQNS